MCCEKKENGTCMKQSEGRGEGEKMIEIYRQGGVVFRFSSSSFIRKRKEEMKTRES